MNKFIVLLVAAVLIEGYFAAEIASKPAAVGQQANHKIVTRDVNQYWPGGENHADADGYRNGNGRFNSEAFSFSSGQDKDGNTVQHGLQVVDNNGQKKVQKF